MARPEYHTQDQRDRLFRNTKKDIANNGVRDLAILRLLYGLPVRPIEICRFSTNDFANEQGQVLPNENAVIRAEIAFNGRERPMPILDPTLIEALQTWVSWRIEHQWGLTSTGYIDVDSKFFQSKKDHAFSVSTSYNNGAPKHNCENINRIIRKRLKINGVTGSVDSAMRTWTLDRYREGRSLLAIKELRGDSSIETVKSIVGKDPIRLAALVERIY